MSAAATRRDALLAAAAAALGDGKDQAVVRQLADWLDSHPGDELALHWYVLLLRARDERGLALAALERGGAANTANAGLAQLLAQVALEAGRPAEALFERAVALAPANGDARMGLVSARFAAGNGPAARAELDTLLAGNPGWEAGHRQFAHLCALLGDAASGLATVDRALAMQPQAPGLHLLGIDLMAGAERYSDMLERTEQAIRCLGELPELQVHLAAARDELGQPTAAAAQFERLGPAREPQHAVRRLRHLLRTGAFETASRELEPWLARPGAEAFWPYASLAWRLAGDSRAQWLDGQDGLYRVVDLDLDELQLPQLADLLRGLHNGAGRFLDQSVRGGTQTDGPLLARTEPVIVNLRRVLAQAVSRHAACLPPPDPGHPVLREPRDQAVCFAGSWSVRLDGAGFHASHHHPQGWLSSALYIAVPDGLSGDEGQLALGESPADLGLWLPPLATVEPRPGRLVLFPSTMWHGTRPFGAGERMSVAFDVARPC